MTPAIIYDTIIKSARMCVRRGNKVIISYNKLWHLMLDKKMNKQDLKRVTGISTASIAKLGKGKNITTDVLVKICKTLDCELEDIMQLSHEDEK